MTCWELLVQFQSITDPLNSEFHIDVYTLDKIGAIIESENEENGDQMNLSTQWILPSADLFGLWESLYYDDNIKKKVSSFHLSWYRLYEYNFF